MECFCEKSVHFLLKIGYICNNQFNLTMTALQKAAELLPELSQGEKAQLLQWVARDLSDAFPGIDRTADICGGLPRIVRTRIPVWLLVAAHKEGATEAALLAAYPTLRAEDLTNAWSYYRAHDAEIDLQIQENEAA